MAGLNEEWWLNNGAGEFVSRIKWYLQVIAFSNEEIGTNQSIVPLDFLLQII